MSPAELYATTAPVLLRTCARLLGSRPEAEDVVQQLFVDLLRRGPADADLPYLRRAAVSRCLNRLRDHRRRADLLAREGVGRLSIERPRVDEQLVDQDLILRLVDRMGEREGEVFALHLVEGIDQSEVASLLGTSRRTVHADVGRIRAHLVELGLGGRP